MASSMILASANGGMTATGRPQPPVCHEGPVCRQVFRRRQQLHTRCQATSNRAESPAANPMFKPVYLDPSPDGSLVLTPPRQEDSQVEEAEEEDEQSYDMYVDDEPETRRRHPQQPHVPAVPAKALTPLQQSGKQDRSLSVQSVQWYPGHIARAERQLKEQLKMVDVVLEVRDARIPVSTHHPQVASWVGPKPRLLVINRQDQVSEADRRAWAEHYKSTGQRVFWTQGKAGDGVKALKQVLGATSDAINKKRAQRGLQPRPVRACVIGFPNIGKSALINRLLGRKAVASAPKPGVTRQLQWVRLTGQLDLLDAPGVIPGSFNDQVSAQRLAVCNDIGEAAYIDSLIAQSFVVRCKMLPSGPALMKVLRERYKVDPEVGTAEEFVLGVANRLFFGDTEKAGQRILKDYRNGLLGAFALERPEDIDEKRAREIETTAAKALAAAKRKTKDDDEF